MGDQQKLFLAFRQALLACVAAIELYLGISPTTASLRKQYKQQLYLEQQTSQED